MSHQVEESRTRLKSRILEEMTVNYSDNLDKSFDLAKRFIRINSEGRIEILVREKLNGKDQILLYLIGKLYAKEAGLSLDEYVGNAELLDQLGVPVGSLLPWLKELRDDKEIKQDKRESNVYHTIHPARIADALAAIQLKLSRNDRS
jgi:hypothetical protein